MLSRVNQIYRIADNETDEQYYANSQHALAETIDTRLNLFALGWRLERPAIYLVAYGAVELDGVSPSCPAMGSNCVKRCSHLLRLLRSLRLESPRSTIPFLNLGAWQ